MMDRATRVLGRRVVFPGVVREFRELPRTLGTLYLGYGVLAYIAPRRGLWPNSHTSRV